MQPLGASTSNEVTKLNNNNSLNNAENNDADKNKFEQVVNPIVLVAQFETLKLDCQEYMANIIIQGVGFGCML